MLPSKAAFSLLQSAGEERALVPVDDVALEAEALVVFHAWALDLGIAAEGEDVVPDRVLLAVVLVEAAVGRPVNQVVLGEDVGGALVEVDAPAAVFQPATSWKRLPRMTVPSWLPRV